MATDDLFYPATARGALHLPSRAAARARQVPPIQPHRAALVNDPIPASASWLAAAPCRWAWVVCVGCALGCNVSVLTIEVKCTNNNFVSELIF